MAKKVKKYFKGGKIGKSTNFGPPVGKGVEGIDYDQLEGAHPNLGGWDIDSTWEFKKGGKVRGKSHAKGGVDINVEGGEYIIKKDSVNAKTEPVLENINKTGTVKKDSLFPISNNKYEAGK